MPVIFAGRYRIERFLAKGGFGAVYVAEQTETELVVALKVLWPHVLHSKDAVEKFKLEARVAGRVGSEHIVRVLDETVRLGCTPEPDASVTVLATAAAVTTG